MIAPARRIGFLLVLLAVVSMAVQGLHSSRPSMSLLSSFLTPTDTDLRQSAKLSPLMRSVLKLRGGEEEEETAADDEEEKEEEEDDDEEEEEEEEEDKAPASGIDYAAIMEKAIEVTKEVIEVTKVRVVPVVAKYSKKSAVTAKKTSITIYKAIRRAISAALEGEETEDDDEDSDDEDDDEDGETATTALDKVIAISKKVVACAKRMVKAAMTVPEDEAAAEEDDEEEEEEEATAETTEEETAKDAEEKVEASTAAEDFGSYLAEAYGVADERASGKAKAVTIMGGSLSDALQSAKQQSRMLLVFIPAEKPEGERGGLFGRGKKADPEAEEADKIAIESLLSKEVSKAANRKALKKGDGSGSFAVWMGKSGSSEAASAIKQLKVDSKGKRPVMCVVYPAASSGKIAPQVLAQHHCNPPMQAESMSSWMSTLRKRHGKQYQSMQHDMKELRLLIERQEGFIESSKSDKERKVQEAKEEAERKAQEAKEAARQAEIDARRQELQESLPEDVKKGNNVKKIALRFPDGRSGQRGFESDQPFSVVFNWVDAMFEIERETVVLTTLNGKETYSWDEAESANKTLEETGLKKMTAFRVTAP